VKQDYFIAADLYKKACDDGVAGGCIGLGGLYSNGQGVKQNTQTSLELYGKSCDMRDQYGCDMYAKLKNKGR
jgi:TPR repeat protein